MDGRDIGTVVFPNAELKICMTASAETRAKRRFDELKSKGQEVSFEEVLKNVEQRDYIDTHREDSPLLQADDAIEIDNSYLKNLQQESGKAKIVLPQYILESGALASRLLPPLRDSLICKYFNLYL